VDAAALLPRWLPDAPELGGAPARSWSPAALAFIGDSVWEARSLAAPAHLYALALTRMPMRCATQLYARRHYFAPSRLHATYVSKVSSVTRAETQAAVIAALAAAHLTEAEKKIVKWGRNAQTGRVPGRLRASGGVYRDATSLEVLVGYLYVSDPPRLEALMRVVGWDDVRAAETAAATAADADADAEDAEDDA
jgi:ribonuclease-3 family protein